MRKMVLYLVFALAVAAGAVSAFAAQSDKARPQYRMPTKGAVSVNRPSGRAASAQSAAALA